MKSPKKFFSICIGIIVILIVVCAVSFHYFYMSYKGRELALRNSLDLGASAIIATSTTFSGTIVPGQAFSKDINNVLRFSLATTSDGWIIHLTDKRDGHDLVMPADYLYFYNISDSKLQNTILSYIPRVVEPQDISGGSSQHDFSFAFATSTKDFEKISDGIKFITSYVAKTSNPKVQNPAEYDETTISTVDRAVKDYNELTGRMIVSLDQVIYGKREKNRTEITQLNFTVNLNFPVMKKDTLVTAKTIHDVDLYTYVKETHAPQPTDCQQFETLYPQNFEVTYADLDHDGQDEATVRAQTCLSGTAGFDIHLILKLLPGGKITELSQ